MQESQYKIEHDKARNLIYQISNPIETNLGERFQVRQLMQSNNQRSSTCLASLNSISLMPVVETGVIEMFFFLQQVHRVYLQNKHSFLNEGNIDR